jgi:hypothetical protein
MMADNTFSAIIIVGIIIALFLATGGAGPSMRGKK